MPEGEAPTPTDADERRAPAGMRTVWVLALGSFATGSGLLVVAGIVPRIAADLRVSTAAGGQVVTVFSLAFALLAPLLAACTGRIPRRPLLIAALALFVLANLLSALVPAYVPLLATRVLAAAAMALYTPNAAAVAANLVPPRYRGRALAIVLGGMSLATIFGVPLGTAVGSWLGWRATFATVAAIGVCALAGLALALPAVHALPPASLAERLAPLRRPPVLVNLAVTMLTTGGIIGLYTYLASVLAHTADVHGALLAVVLLVYGLGGGLGTAISGRAVDRFGALRVLVVALGVIVLTEALVPVATSAATASLLLFVWGAAGWAFAIPQQYRLLALAPAQPSIAVSLHSSASYLGQAVGAALAGAALSRLATSPERLAPFGAVSVALALVVATVAHMWQARSTRTPTEFHVVEGNPERTGI